MKKNDQKWTREQTIVAFNLYCKIPIPELLIASHIIPWKDEKNAAARLDPRNGLCLNALHDKMFDRGFLTIDADFSILISRKILEKKSDATGKWIFPFHGKQIQKPDRFVPKSDFLKYHRDFIFQK
jgi:putative restriction endonuclease